MVGEVTHVNHELLEVLLDKKYVPVVSPVGLGEDGEGYNINADSAAAEIAIALKAEKLIYLTDVAGILENGELVSEMSASELRARARERRHPRRDGAPRPGASSARSRAASPASTSSTAARPTRSSPSSSPTAASAPSSTAIRPVVKVRPSRMGARNPGGLGNIAHRSANEGRDVNLPRAGPWWFSAGRVVADRAS